MTLRSGFCVYTLCPGRASIYPLNSVPCKGKAGPSYPSSGTDMRTDGEEAAGPLNIPSSITGSLSSDGVLGKAQPPLPVHESLLPSQDHTCSQGQKDPVGGDSEWDTGH